MRAVHALILQAINDPARETRKRCILESVLVEVLVVIKNPITIYY